MPNEKIPYVAPLSVQDLNERCFTSFGGGSTICIRKYRTEQHRGGQFPVVSDEGFILKSKDRLFSDPHLDLNIINQDLVAE